MAKLRNTRTTREGNMIDVDFEHDVRVLQRVWDALSHSSAGDDDYHQLCRALRDAKMSFTDVDRWYRKGYNTSRLESLVSQIGDAISDMARSRYSRSIRRHVRDILRVAKQRANPRRRGVAIYASSCA